VSTAVAYAQQMLPYALRASGNREFLPTFSPSGELGGKSPAEVTPHGVGRCHKVAEGTGLLDLRWFAG